MPDAFDRIKNCNKVLIFFGSVHRFLEFLETGSNDTSISPRQFHIFLFAAFSLKFLKGYKNSIRFSNESAKNGIFEDEMLLKMEHFDFFFIGVGRRNVIFAVSGILI